MNDSNPGTNAPLKAVPGRALEGAAWLSNSSAAAWRALAPVLTVLTIVALAVLLFLPDFRSLADLWLTQPGSSQGPLIVAIALGLIWFRRHELKFEHSTIAALPLLGLAGATAATVAARAASIGFVGWALWPLIVWFAIRLAMGARTARCIALPAAYFLLAAPILGVLAAPLQTLTATAAALLLRVASLSAVIEGRYVTIQEGRFEIAEGCAGTHFLTAALAAGTLFALFLGLPLKRMILVVAGSLVVGLVANWVRVVSIIEIGHLTAMQSSLLADHDAFGWIIFTVLLLAFFLAARRLAVGIPLRTRPPVALPPSLASGARAVAIGTAALVMAPVWSTGVERAASREVPPSLELPTVRAWTGPLSYQADWHPAFPGAAIERLADYRMGDARVEVFAAFYNVQLHGAKLFGSDSNVAGREPWIERARRVRRLPGDAIETILVDDGGRARIVWHWFEVRGERLTSGASVKLHQSLAAFGLPARSGVVALSTRCEPNCDTAETLLADAYRGGLGTWTMSDVKAAPQP